ncbi:MAG: acetyl-CoA carboxylase, carboxyltransferase subunit beta [Oligoflexales bacterium]
MNWSDVKRAPLGSRKPQSQTLAKDHLWLRCTECSEILYRKDFEKNLRVCDKCDHHSFLPPEQRLRDLLDEGYRVIDDDLWSQDPLKFKDTQDYAIRLKKMKEKGATNEAVVAAEGNLHGISLQVGVFDFQFMGGSMGAVAGEKLARIFLRAAEKKQPAVVFSASGGARMQEGALSLMQMAKTCVALDAMKSKGCPMISVLCHPTTGGVAASYAMLGDINIAEPKALIGFAGPRVIQQTIGEKLPEGFQMSEYLLEHGMVDMICQRSELREKIYSLLNLMVHRNH